MIYFNPMDVTLTRTPVCAWVETAKALRGADGFHLGGVNVHIQNPSLINDREIAVFQHVDSFLREHGQYPISTVANTIFPQSLDHGDGAEALAAHYERIFQCAMKSGGGTILSAVCGVAKSEGWPANQPIGSLD